MPVKNIWVRGDRLHVHCPDPLINFKKFCMEIMGVNVWIHHEYGKNREYIEEIVQLNVYSVIKILKKELH